MKTVYAGIIILSPFTLFSVGLAQETEEAQTSDASTPTGSEQPIDAISVFDRYNEAIVLIKVEGKTQEAASILADIVDELRPNSSERETALKILKKARKLNSSQYDRKTIQQRFQLNLSVDSSQPQSATPEASHPLFPISPKGKKALNKDKHFANHYGGQKKEVFCKGVGLVTLTASQNDGTETEAVLIGGSWGPDKSYIQSKGGQWEYLLTQHIPIKENCNSERCKKQIRKNVLWSIQPNHHSHQTSLTYIEKHSQNSDVDVNTPVQTTQSGADMHYTKVALSLIELSMPELSKSLKPELEEKHMPYWGRVVRYLSHRKPQRTQDLAMEPWGMYTLLQLYHWGLPKTATRHFINRLYVTVNGPKLQYLLRRRTPNNKIREMKNFKLNKGNLKGTLFSDCIEIHTDVTVRKSD